MTPPRCVVCHEAPVKRRRWGCTPARGLRIIAGVSWNWFCSKRCSGLDCGRTNISSQRVRVAVALAREARIRQARERQVAEVAQDVQVLVGYGVPRAVAIATLLRLVQRTRARVKDAVYYEYVRKPRHEQQALRSIV